MFSERDERILFQEENIQAICSNKSYNKTFNIKRMSVSGRVIWQESKNLPNSEKVSKEISSNLTPVSQNTLTVNSYIHKLKLASDASDNIVYASFSQDIEGESPLPIEICIASCRMSFNNKACSVTMNVDLNCWYLSQVSCVSQTFFSFT